MSRARSEETKLIGLAEAPRARPRGDPALRLACDEGGQLVTGTLMDYPVPVASALPSFAIGHLETLSSHTPGGVKAVRPEALAPRG